MWVGEVRCAHWERCLVEQNISECMYKTNASLNTVCLGKVAEDGTYEMTVREMVNACKCDEAIHQHVGRYCQLLRLRHERNQLSWLVPCQAQRRDLFELLLQHIPVICQQCMLRDDLLCRQSKLTIQRRQ